MVDSQAMEHATATGDREAPPASTATMNRQRGGWNTFPFVIVTAAALTLAGGWMSNLIVYLIYEFNIQSIDAAQISNVVSGSSTLIPVVAAIVADSFLGCFSVIWISSVVSLLGLILLLLMVTLHSLQPLHCDKAVTNFCASPSTIQYMVLYLCLVLTVIGQGGTRFVLATMGANQFAKQSDQNIFFNWFFFIIYVGQVISFTGIVYVEENVSWVWASGLCIAANVVGLAVFLIGGRYYAYDTPQGSPFVDLARVVVASVQKRKAAITSRIGDYYHGEGGKGVADGVPTKSFRLLNRAAFKTEGDIAQDGKVAKPWKICTVQQVEDLKNLIKILPLWSTSIFLSTPIGIQMSLSVLQALTMDRHIGPRFKIPAASVLVFILVSCAVSLSLFDHLIWPACKKLVGGRELTPLHRIGIGHILNVASMAMSAPVESRRLATARSHRVKAGQIVPMSVCWLIPQLVVVGVGEAFHFPGQVALYYQEFPESLKTMSAAMVSLLIAIAFYLSTAVIDFVRRATSWLPSDINEGRLDNVYWVLVGIGLVNFGYYLVCSWMYKYKNLDTAENDTKLPELRVNGK